MDDIPSIPNSPRSPASLEDEPFDMVSSIESLAALSPANTIDTRLIPLPSPRGPFTGSLGNSEYSFVMPSPPSSRIEVEVEAAALGAPGTSAAAIAAPVDSPCIPTDNEFSSEVEIDAEEFNSAASGQHLSIALAGSIAASADLFGDLTSILNPDATFNEHGIDVAKTSNVTLFDTSLVGSTNVSQWLETRLSEQPVDAVLYSLSGRNCATAADLVVMHEIQKLAVLVVVADTSEDLVNLARNGILGFRQHIFSRRDSAKLARAVVEQSEHIRALASYLHTKWYENQLVHSPLALTVRPAVGSLCPRVDLRSRAFQSIESVDPLGLNTWSSLSRSAVYIASAAVATLFCDGIVFSGPAEKRHALFEIHEHVISSAPEWITE